MQVQKINTLAQPTNFNLSKTTTNCISGDNHCSVNSMYSPNMSGLAFCGAPTVKRSFAKEIAEQPKVLKKLSKRFFNKAEGVNLDLNIKPEDLANVKRITIVASGSSKNAGEMAKDFIEDLTGIPVLIESASEYMCKKSNTLNPKEDLGIFISQSGKTADTLKALNHFSEKNVNTIAITNTKNSPIADMATSHINIDAGEEKAVAATKTVTSSIYSLMAVGLKIAEMTGKVGKKTPYHEELSALPEKLNLMLIDTDDVKTASKIISNAENIYYYAKGSNVGAVKEGALKLTETTGKRVIADSSSEALHGTFASIRPENPVLEVVVGKNTDDNYKIACDNILEIAKKRNVKNPIIIKNYSDEEIVKHFENYEPIFINIPQANEKIAPLYTTVRMQQITNEVTKNLKIDPDNGGGFLTKFRQEISM